MSSPERPPPQPHSLRVLAERGSTPRPPEPPGGPERDPGYRRLRWVAIVLGALALGLGVATAVIVAGGPREVTVTQSITSTKRVQPTTTTTVVTTTPPPTTTTTTKTTKTVTDTTTVTETQNPPKPPKPPGGGG